MNDSRYRWVIVAAGGLLGCVAAGSLFSLPVLLQSIARDTGWSVAGVSSAMTIAFLAMACASMAWGTLSDRWGPLPVVLTGSTVLAVSLALASQATSLVAFQFTFGLLVGGSIAAIIAPMMACVTGWFDTHRSLAVSLVSAGMGIAPMTMAPLVAWLVSGHDWRTTMQIVAGIVAAIMIPVSLLVRRPPALATGNVAAPAGGGAPAEMSVREAVRSPQFIILLLTNFFCCATHSGPIIHTVSYAVSCGIPLIAAVFGFIYAGTMPLYAAIARENFPLKMMGTVIGGTAMAGSLGMATGPVAGGLIYDSFASYTWLYVGSWAMGIGAFLIAMTFRPFPKTQ